MNKEEIEELMEYNLEYLEAVNSEEIFGGDYTSSVDLKYANKEIDKLQQENKQLKERIDNQEFLLKSQGNELKELYLIIDKAIKYLEQPNRDNFDFSKAILLEILKGDSSENN